MGERLTERLVRAARSRMEHSMGALSLRQALLYDRTAGVTDLDVGRWMQHGEELRARGVHVDDEEATKHDRLCLELLAMESARGNRILMYGGEATARILSSTDQKMAGHQVQLIKHAWEVFGEQPNAAELAGVTTARGDLDVSQADMDLLTEDEMRATEADVRLRAEAGARIRARFETARRRVASGGEADVVH